MLLSLIPPLLLVVTPRRLRRVLVGPGLAAQICSDKIPIRIPEFFAGFAPIRHTEKKNTEEMYGVCVKASSDARIRLCERGTLLCCYGKHLWAVL